MIYSDELATRICEQLAAGWTLKQVCRQEGMPDESTVRRWALDADSPFYPLYARARELGYHRMADEIIEIADDATNDWVTREGKDGKTELVVDHEHINRSRLRVDSRKWLLSKALPKIYGDKLQHAGADGGNLTINILRFNDGNQPPKQLAATTVPVEAVELHGERGQAGSGSLPPPVG